MLKEAGSFSAIAFILFVGAYVYIASQGGNMNALWSMRIAPVSAPISPSDYHTLARQDAVNAGIDPTLYERQINQESGFNPNAVSQAGAIGIAQIMPDTAKSWGVNPWDPTASLNVAAQHMAWYQSHYGNFAKALACYNAGCSSLESAMSRCADYYWCLPSETQRYITAITGAQP